MFRSAERGVVTECLQRMASFGSYHCHDCNISFPYPSKLKRHLETRKHQLLVTLDDAAAQNAPEQMELESSDVGEQGSDFNVEQLGWSNVSSLSLILKLL